MTTVELQPRPVATYEPPAPPSPAPRRKRRFAVRGLHLAVLWSFGVARPLFAELDDGFYFVFFDFGRLDIVIFGLLATIGLPLALVAVEALVSLRSRRVAWWLHLGFVAALAGIFASQLYVSAAEPSGGIQSLVSVVAALAFAAGYAKAEAIRAILTVLGPVPLAFLVLFLFFSPVAKLVVSGEGSPPARPVALPAPVVMIVLDEFPGSALMDARGEIDAKRFPNFAELARGSTWFRNATTVHSFTEHAVPAIVSGQRSEHGSLPTASDHRRNLFAILSANPMSADEPSTSLCPVYACPDSRSLGNRSFGSRISFMARDMAAHSGRQWLPPQLSTRISIAELPGTEPGAQAASFARSIRRTGRPGLHYMHLLLPHSPWVYLPSGKRYADADSSLAGLETPRWPRDPWTVTQAHQAFLLQLGYTDRLLGQVFDRLRSTGVYDDALVIVVADHGVSFRAGQLSRDATRSAAEDIMPVPLFIKRPGQRRGGKSDAFVRTTDVVPTIADVLGFRLPWRTEGRSVFDTGSPPRRLDISQRSGQRFTVDARGLERRRDRAATRYAARFGAGVDALFRIGPHPELIGRRPGRTAVRRDAHAEVPRRLSVDLDAAEIPARVVGTISGPGAKGFRDLAVSVNGRIAATTQTVPWGGSLEFTALVPESAFRQGTNEFRIYAVTSGRRGPRLAQVPR
jgi:hypothetical protein